MCKKLKARGYNKVQQRIKGTRRLDMVHSFLWAMMMGDDDGRRLDMVHSFFMGDDDDGLYFSLFYIGCIKAFYLE